MANGRPAIEARDLRTLFELGAVGIGTDGQLLERFATRQGEAAELAFAAMVDRHGPMVLRVARSILRDDHAAHDVFQATFLVLARKARTLRVRDSVGPWLHAVALRVAMNGRSAAVRRRRHEREAAGPESTRPRDPDDLGPAIQEEIDRLPEGHRSAVVLCHLEGLTQHEAARRLGWPVGTLQSRLARGRARLRDRLAGRGLAPSIAPLAAGPVPEALVAATARAAVALNGGGAIAGMIAPPVLAMIHATTKGMLMAKLKLGAVALLAALGLVASATGPGAVRSQGATGGPPLPTQAQVSKGKATALEPVPVPETARGTDLAPLKGEVPEETATVLESVPAPAKDPIPPPADGPGFPVMLEFYNSQHVLDARQHQDYDRLRRAGYLIKSIDISTSKDLAEKYQVHGSPAVLLVAGTGAEIARSQGLMTGPQIARFYNDNRPGRVTEAARPLPPPTIPKPWATAVRVKVRLTDQQWGFGSGTVIRSTPEESIILACAHTLRGEQAPVTVDLFDGQLTGRKPAMVRCNRRDLAAEVVALDFGRDLCLLRIRPGGVLPASPVAPIGSEPADGWQMIAVGCSRGADATAWTTSIIGFSPYTGTNNRKPSPPANGLKCNHRPVEGRSGGGLFTTDGYLVGVCIYALPDEDAGLYAHPGVIRSFLDDNKLAALYEGIPEEPGLDLDGPGAVDPPRKPDAPRPAPAPAVDPRDRRLDELERKLDRLLDSLQALPKGDFPLPRR